MLFLRALPLVWQLAIGGTVLAAVAGGVAYIYNRGENAAFDKIGASNEKVIDNARAGTKEANDCDDSGGTWDVIDGVCRR
jgi:hypothetical protein